MRMCQEGEAIWDRMLQELFIVRRHIELSSFRTESPQKLQKDCLETLEEFYHSLQKLSEYLYPAYIDDNLPLAIRQLLDSWKLPIPLSSNIELELPTDWHHEPHERIRVILIALDELLKIKFSEIKYAKKCKEKSNYFSIFLFSTINIYANLLIYQELKMRLPVNKPNKQKFLVVDDEELIIHATIDVLKKKYPEAEIFKAKTAYDALNQVPTIKPDLVVIDLSMPEAKGDYIKTTDIGLQLLKKLMQCYPSLNIVVQTAHPRHLIRLKLTISDHEGGFTVADKSLPMDEMLTRVEWALKGAHCTPKDMRSRLEVKSEWLELLQLAFKEELRDKAIGERMNVAERTVRHYWRKIQDALGVYPDAHKNLRIQTEKRAREEGLID